MASSSSTSPKHKLTTTSFLLSNLHCPSCVSHIKEVLSCLTPPPLSVAPSVLSSSVTVIHEEGLSIHQLENALEQAGFDICDMTNDLSQPGPEHKPHVPSNNDIGYLDRFIHKFPSDRNRPAKSKYPARHIDNCESCRLLDNKGQDGPSTSQTSLPSSSGENGSSRPKMEKTLSPSLVVVPVPGEKFRATLAIGGMTCAACVGTITEELEKKDWIEKVIVNLISNSATIDFVEEKNKDRLVESVEDLGFDAVVDNIVNIKNLYQAAPKTVVRRNVEIFVDGMFCPHCPGRVMKAIEDLGDNVKIEGPLDLQNQILKVSYIPDAPKFTIRNIIETISAVEPSIISSIYHPPTLEERSRQLHRREQLRILIRVILTLVIAIPTLIIGIVYMSLVDEHDPGRMWLMKPLRAGVSRAQWALFVMATPVYFLCADVFHVRAFKEVRAMWRRGSKTPYLQRFLRFGSMNMLMSLGTSIAYISSAAQLIAAGVAAGMSKSLDPIDPIDESTFYFDSVVFLTLFLLIGRLIESYSKSKTGDAVTMLGKLRPTVALLVVHLTSDSESTGGSSTGESNSKTPQSETLKTVNVDLLEFGDTVKVVHGGSPPCDGTLIQGETKFDESSLTGESRLVKKVVGDEVFSGTVNKGSPVSIKVTGVAGSSMLDQIVKAVREGQTRRAPIERIADSLTSYFVPAVTLIAIITWITWLSLGLSGALPKHWREQDSSGWTAWSLQFAIAVFVVACPCGLALAAPTALYVGGGLAARYGILVKGGGEAFEKASRLDCIVFDKTGTLTVGGEPVITDYQILPVTAKFGDDGTISGSTLLGMISSIEENSSHTVAKAIKTFCNERETQSPSLGQIDEIAGKGMCGTFSIGESKQMDMLVGNEVLMNENNVAITVSTQAVLESWKAQGRSVALAAITSQEKPASWELAAIFAISDPIRPEAPSIIQALQTRGTAVWMLSGDNQITANAIGAQVGIPAENIIAGVLPSEKADQIRYLQKCLKATTSSGKDHIEKRALIAMVGDGINDSPALTTADVGIAIGSGSDIAISSAEFVLVSSNLTSLITLLDLSRFVFRRIKFNFAWALVYNMIALPVAAGVLYPLVENGKHVRLDPVWASLAMAASSVSVVCSSLLLRSRIPWVGFKVPRFENLEGEGEE